MENCFDITDFGAISDGKTDCTKAIQGALDAAEKVRGCVIVPPEKYLCGKVRVGESVSLMGMHGWGYRDIGGSVLELNDASADCLLDLTGAHGAQIKGLQLLGKRMGQNVHGIKIQWELYNGNGETFFDGYTTNFHEDSTLVDDCQVREFSGDGIHLDHIFAFTIRNTQVIFNGGNGIYIDGWDGWINNCIFTINDKYGMLGKNNCSSITTIGNRVEWNRLGGYYFENGGDVIVNASSFDRNFGPALTIAPDMNWHSHYIVTSNIFYRNGKPRETPFESPYQSSHVYAVGVSGLVLSQNTFRIGKDDGGGGVVSPDYAVVYGDLKDSVITGNAITGGAVKETLIDLGGNEENNIIRDNA